MIYDYDILYKLWLNITCDHDPGILHKIIKEFGSAKEIYTSDEVYDKFLSGLKLRYMLKTRRSLDQAEKLLEYCEENGIKILCIGDKGYPQRLSETYCPPQILYVKGELPDIDNLVCMTIVGSRDCSDYSRGFANEIAYDLTKSGIVVISGMALGIDASAHVGAMYAGGITVAALAGGVDVIYPKAHKNLYNDILERGAIISERPPGMRGYGSYYKERNRLLVGLSNGVVIVAGKEKSGTRLTANWAISENRDLFAVPGKPGDVGSELPNALIKESAKLITSAEDIVEEYISTYSIELQNGLNLISEDDEVKQNRKRKSEWGNAHIEVIPEEKMIPDMSINIENYSGNQRIILECLLNKKDTVHIDDIARECGLNVSDMSIDIVLLLMNRAIKEHPGQYYSLR